MKKLGLLIIFVACFSPILMFFNNVNKEVHPTSNKNEMTKESIALYKKIKSGQPINILVVGDSIAYGSGSTDESMRWYSLISSKLDERYGVKSNVKNIAKGGSDVFDGNIEYLDKVSPLEYYDLAFIVFGQNDQTSLKPDQYRLLYEQLVQNIKISNPEVELYAIIESSIKSDAIPNELKKVAKQYNLVTIDTREAYKNSGLPDTELTIDGVHPNDKGYKIYADQIFNIMESYIENGRTMTNVINTHSSNELKRSGYYSNISGFKHYEGYLLSNNKDDFIEYQFNGTLLGITFLYDVDAGIANIYIDNKLIKQVNTNTFRIERHILVADNLDDTKHVVRIEVSGEKGEKSQGTFIKVKNLLVKN